MKKIGYFAIGFLVFLIGVSVGQRPTEEEHQQQMDAYLYKQDITEISTRYASLYDMCEQKYSYGIKGNMNKAFELKGAMSQVENEINAIKSKYQPTKPL